MFFLLPINPAGYSWEILSLPAPGAGLWNGTFGMGIAGFGRAPGGFQEHGAVSAGNTCLGPEVLNFGMESGIEEPPSSLSAGTAANIPLGFLWDKLRIKAK